MAAADAARQRGAAHAPEHPAVVPVPPHLKSRKHPANSVPSSAPASPTTKRAELPDLAAAWPPAAQRGAAIADRLGRRLTCGPAATSASDSPAPTRGTAPAPHGGDAAPAPVIEPFANVPSALRAAAPAGRLAAQQKGQAQPPGRYQMPSGLLHTYHGGMILPPPGPTAQTQASPRQRPTSPLTALRVHSVTWNMGRTKPTHDLAGFLRGEFLGVSGGAGEGSAASGEADAVPDVIVVGTQENAAPGPWLDLLQGVLRPEGYVLLRGAASMNSAPGGSFVMSIAVFVRRELEERFSDVLVGRVTCGLGNKAGNKGACAVAFTVSGGTAADETAEPTRVLLLCCHLEAHSHRLQRRNANMRHILSTLHLKPPRSRRGLSQTLLTSFLPSHMSPLRGRSRTRASAADSQYLTATSSHARGHSLPANTPAFNPHGGWPAIKPQPGAPAEVRGVAEGRQHMRAQSLHGLRSPRITAEASDGALDGPQDSWRTRRSASLPSGSLQGAVAEAASTARGPPEDRDAAVGMRLSHSAVVASLQHWDCSRVDVGCDGPSGSDCGNIGAARGTRSGGGCGSSEESSSAGLSGGGSGAMPARYAGSDSGSWGFSDASGSLADSGRYAQPPHCGTPAAERQARHDATEDADGALVAALRPGWAGQSPDVPLRKEDAWSGACKGAHLLSRQVSRSADEMRRSLQAVRSRMSRGAPEPPGMLPAYATPRAATPPAGASGRPPLGSDGALLRAATPGSSGRMSPDLRRATMRLGREISTPKLAAGFAGDASVASHTPSQHGGRGSPLRADVRSATGNAARAARLRHDLMEASEDSPLAAAVCEGVRGAASDSLCSSMHMGGIFGDSDDDSLAQAFSTASDAPHPTLNTALAHRYFAPPVPAACAVPADVPAVARCTSEPPPCSIEEADTRHTIGACQPGPTQAQEGPVPVVTRLFSAAMATGQLADRALQADAPLQKPKGHASRHTSRSGSKLADELRPSSRPDSQEGRPVVEALRPHSGSSCGSDKLHAPASPGPVSQAELQREAAALRGRPVGGPVTMVEQVGPASPFAWRCNSLRRQGSQSPGHGDSPVRRPPRAPGTSAMQIRLCTSRVAPLPALSVAAPPDIAPIRTSYSAPTSPVARRMRAATTARAAQLPPLGPFPASAQSPQRAGAADAAAGGAGVGEAAVAVPPTSPSLHDSARMPAVQQPLWWLPSALEHVATQAPAVVPVTLQPLAVEPVSAPTSPIAADASPVWRGAAGGIDTSSWRPGVPLSEERDISEEFDMALLLGDLNYRVDMEPEDVLRALNTTPCKPPALAPLFACDQLSATMRSCELHPLQHFQESACETHMPFPPTYKFHLGTDEYDSRRTPSWTDRILWRSNYHLDGCEPVEAVRYACVPCMKQSDHRPVVATIVVRLKHSSRVTHDQTAGVGEGEAAVREGRARGRALRKWLGEATTRLRALGGPMAAPVGGPIVADGDFAPFRHNAQMLRLGVEEGCVRASRSLPRTMRLAEGGAL
eukprot:jgi/Ulvmu1/3882/UM018_0103.1